jgi:HAD superfamily hydrolase (TIGR01509 family)
MSPERMRVRADAVLFDLFETLVTVDASRLPVLRVGTRSQPSAIAPVLVELSKAEPTLDEADVLTAMAALRADPPRDAPPNAEFAEHLMFAALLRRLGVNDEGNALAHRLADAQMLAIVAACRPIPGARELLADLRARGFRTAVVSNLAHAASLDALLAVADPDHRFDAAATSIEVGFCKPDERPFRLALTRVGIEAGRAIHVGDDPYGDVVGAGRAGIQPVWFNPAGRPWAGGAAEPTTVTRLEDIAALLAAPGSTTV